MSTEAEIFREMASGLLRQFRSLVLHMPDGKKKTSMLNVNETLDSLVNAVSDSDFENGVQWTLEDNRHSFQNGWGLFETDEGQEIHGLDDPEAACEDVGVESLRIFEGNNRDRKAAKYVQQEADKGDPTCRKAIELLIETRSKDVKRFGLKKTW